MKLQASSTKPYSNCTVYSQSNDLIFRCSTRKMLWYLKRGLAEQIGDSPPAIRLLFEPKGRGHEGDRFFLQARKNECVVCGKTENLTKHHVLPRSYRRWFPRSLDCYGPYDIFALCTNHHEHYEKAADALRQILAEEYGAPLNGAGGNACPIIRKADGAAHALIQYRDKIPKHKIAKLEHIVRRAFGNSNMSPGALKELVKANRAIYKTHGQIVVENLICLDEINNFIIRWRKHFLETMAPKYLPKWWKADRVFAPKA